MDVKALAVPREEEEVVEEVTEVDLGRIVHRERGPVTSVMIRTASLDSVQITQRKLKRREAQTLVLSKKRKATYLSQATTSFS